MNLALGTTLILCALASMPASAQDTDRLALQRAATGQGFTIGDTNFRLVPCLLYTSDAADDMQCVDLGGRRIIKKKK